MKGRNTQENEFIKMGGYHTIDLEPNRRFTVYKERWDSVTLERVDNAADPTKVGEDPTMVGKGLEMGRSNQGGERIIDGSIQPRWGKDPTMLGKGCNQGG